MALSQKGGAALLQALGRLGRLAGRRRVDNCYDDVHGPSQTPRAQSLSSRKDQPGLQWQNGKQAWRPRKL